MVYIKPQYYQLFVLLQNNQIINLITFLVAFLLFDIIFLKKVTTLKSIKKFAPLIYVISHFYILLSKTGIKLLSDSLIENIFFPKSFIEYPK